jgi:rusticyanin
MLGILVLVVVVILVPIGYFIEQDFANANGPNGFGCNCFDGNPYVPSSLYNGTSQINADAANATARHIPASVLKGADVIRKNDTIIFHTLNVTLLVFANSNTWVQALTKMPIPGYDNVSVTSNAFDIDGLYMPTLVIPNGATINVTFINMDATDHHNFVLSTFPPPYDEYIMQSMNVNGSMVTMTPLLSPISSSNMASEFQYNVVLQTNATRMWYLCMFPNHAMLGMYGNITIS